MIVSHSRPLEKPSMIVESIDEMTSSIRDIVCYLRCRRTMEYKCLIV